MRCGPYQADGERALVGEEQLCNPNCKYFTECQKEIALPADTPYYHWFQRTPTIKELEEGKWHYQVTETPNGVELKQMVWDKISWGQYQKLCRQHKRLPKGEV